MEDQDNHSVSARIVDFCREYRNLLVVFVVAIAVRMILSWFVACHDSISWLKTIQNVESGVGLYKLEGLWYTPVFGYLLSFMAGLGDLLGCFPIHYTSVPEFISTGFENLPTPEMNFFIKIPMVIGDIAVALILYKLVGEYKDEKWALITVALWMLSPIIFHMSAAQGQFDAICIALFLLCFLCIRKDNFALAGIFLALSVWLKIFPVLCGPLLLIYIYKKFADREEMKKHISLFFVGIIATTIVVFLPQIINGELMESFKFFSSRTTSLLQNNLISQLTSYRIYLMIIIVAILLVVISKKYYSCREENMERMLLVYSAFMIACGASICMGYQYAPCIIFCFIVLALFVKCKRKIFMGAFAIVSILTYLEAAQHVGQMHFAIAGVYYGWFDPAKLASDYIAMSESTHTFFLGVTALWQIIAIAALIFAVICFIWPEKLGMMEVEDGLDD